MKVAAAVVELDPVLARGKVDSSQIRVLARVVELLAA